jgi:plasmid stabilization system protein ParE
MKIIFSEEADLDLLQIHADLEARSRAAALSLAGTFNRKFESLARFPFLGRERSPLPPDFEAWWRKIMSSSIVSSATKY